jgi:propanol-preferring alcohol dehydrogenase
MVAVLSVPGCGEKDCLECGNGNPQVCRNAPGLGIGRDGSFAPYVAIPYRAAALVPEGAPTFSATCQ